MSDLGWTLGWLATRIAILLIPAIGLHALASRRGPASGAWVATLGLGMVVVLTGLTFLPEVGGESEASRTSAPALDQRLAGTPTMPTGKFIDEANRPETSAHRGLTLADLRLAWSRFERRAVGPVARFRPWGKIVALVALAGSGIGLIRLLVGLWAVELCRRRGRVVDDPDLVGLVQELREAMGCGRVVEIREVLDLTTPATAGWFRPMLLLPRDWRGWDESERRAVVAHELAHVIRGDYASGLLARVAVVLNYYHPMVRWLAARLHLEQELAADALGAQFAGGRSSYLLALSRLALEQEERPSSWPARAFLPARGTLIRRITMLKNDHESKRAGRAWSRSKRLATAFGLLALTVGVASWKPPAQAQEYKLGTIDVSAGVTRRTPSFPISYVPAGKLGIVAFHPAAIARQPGMGALATLYRERLLDSLGVDPASGKLMIGRSPREFVKFGCEDIESVVCTFDIGSQQRVVQDPKLKDRKLYSLEIFESGGVTVRMVAPFDWLAFLRDCKLEFEEVSEPRGRYHRITNKQLFAADLHMGVYLPDDRTIVYDTEATLRSLIAREIPTVPTYLQGADWERVSHDLVAFILDNEKDAFAKRLTLGRPEDAPILAFFQGINRLVFGIPDREIISVAGEVLARDPGAAEAAARTINAYLKLASVAFTPMLPPQGQVVEAGGEVEALRMYSSFLTSFRTETKDSMVVVRTEGGIPFAKIAGLLQAELEAMKPRPASGEAKAKIEKP